MSMNLECNLIQMLQTPTHITYMCMINDKGKIPSSYKGKSALAPLLRYAEWEMEHFTNMFNEAKNDKDEQEFCRERLRTLNDTIKDIK